MACASLMAAADVWKRETWLSDGATDEQQKSRVWDAMMTCERQYINIGDGTAPNTTGQHSTLNCPNADNLDRRLGPGGVPYNTDTRLPTGEDDWGEYESGPGRSVLKVGCNNGSGVWRADTRAEHSDSNSGSHSDTSSEMDTIGGEEDNGGSDSDWDGGEHIKLPVV